MLDLALGPRGRRVAAAVASGAAARVLSATIAMLALPLTVRYLGPERFGVWATATSSVVLLSLLDLGIASTLTNHIARTAASGERATAARYFTNALAGTSVLAFLTGALIAAAWPHLNWVRILNVGPGISSSEVGATVAAGIAIVLLGLPASLVGRVFAGYQEVHRYNLVIAAGALANLGGLVVGLALHVNMPTLFVLANGWTVVANALALLVIVRRDKPWLRPRWAGLDWDIAKELVSAGSGFFLLQIAGAVVFSSDNVVLSHFLGPAQVTPYNVTWRVVGLCAVLQGLVFPALWPAYADAHARGDMAWVRRTFWLTMKTTLALNLLFALLLLAVGRPVIRVWAGAGAVPSYPLLGMMALWAVVSGAMTVESCVLAALNRTRAQGALSVVAAALNLGLSVLLVQRIGAVGVIAGTVLSYIVVLIVPQSLIVRRVLSPSPPTLQHAHRPVNPLASFR